MRFPRILLPLLACLCLLVCGVSAQDNPPSLKKYEAPKVSKAWGEFVRQFNASPALRQLTVHINGLNEGARKLNEYEAGRLVAAGEERAQVLDAMKADYAAARRLLPEVDKELSAELQALEAVPAR